MSLQVRKESVTTYHMIQSHHMTSQTQASVGPEYAPYLRQEAEAGEKESWFIRLLGGFTSNTDLDYIYDF